MGATERAADEARYTISTVSSMLGIPIPTIRSWERRYGFPAPGRTQGRHRRYSPHEVDLLRELRDEITRGHPAREAVTMLLSRSSTGATLRTSYLDDLLTAATRLDPSGVRSALDGATDNLGVEITIHDVALPAMRELGTRWAAGTCDIAHEHLATEGVRSWLARHSALAPPPFRPATLVLACGPKDLHTIGLEAFGVLLARRGWGTRLLGPLTPTSTLVSATHATRAAGVLVTSQRSVTRRAAVEAISAVAAIPGVTAFYAGDAFASATTRRAVPGIYLGDDILEAVGVLESALAPRVSARARRPSRSAS